MTKYLKVICIILVLAIAGMYSWSLFATAVNDHADKAATIVIQDTLVSNKAYETKKLREVKQLLAENKSNAAVSLLDKLIDDNLYILDQCLTEKCSEMKAKYYAD